MFDILFFGFRISDSGLDIKLFKVVHRLSCFGFLNSVAKVNY